MTRPRVLCAGDTGETYGLQPLQTHRRIGKPPAKHIIQNGCVARQDGLPGFSAL